MTLARMLGAIVVTVTSACYSPDARPGAPCETERQCPSNQQCVDGFCARRTPGVDAPELAADAAVPEDAPIDGPVDAPSGFCITPADCQISNRCMEAECVQNRCVIQALADGSSCGPAAANRCCSGRCVDISSDTANCGGCGEACAAGRTCESVAVTNTCSSAPAATTGRCTCAGLNSECPDGQLCRSESPYPNRCTPSGSANCSPGEAFVDIAVCPNFCRY